MVRRKRERKNLMDNGRSAIESISCPWIIVLSRWRIFLEIGKRAEESSGLEMKHEILVCLEKVKWGYWEPNSKRNGTYFEGGRQMSWSKELFLSTAAYKILIWSAGFRLIQSMEWCANQKACVCTCLCPQHTKHEERVRTPLLRKWLVAYLEMRKEAVAVCVVGTVSQLRWVPT